MSPEKRKECYDSMLSEIGSLSRFTPSQSLLFSMLHPEPAYTLLGFSTTLMECLRKSGGDDKPLLSSEYKYIADAILTEMERMEKMRKAREIIPSDLAVYKQDFANLYHKIQLIFALDKAKESLGRLAKIRNELERDLGKISKESSPAESFIQAIVNKWNSFFSTQSEVNQHLRTASDAARQTRPTEQATQRLDQLTVEAGRIREQAKEQYTLWEQFLSLIGYKQDSSSKKKPQM